MECKFKENELTDEWEFAKQLAVANGNNEEGKPVGVVMIVNNEAFLLSPAIAKNFALKLLAKAEAFGLEEEEVKEHGC